MAKKENALKIWVVVYRRPYLSSLEMTGSFPTASLEIQADEMDINDRDITFYDRERNRIAFVSDVLTLTQKI